MIRSSVPAAACLMLALVMVATASRAATENGRMPAYTSFDVYSRVMKENRHINVYVPPKYDAAEKGGYPVLYMLDGGLKEDFPHVASDVDAAIRTHEMEPVIVIGIENTQRRRDMTGPTNVASDRKIAPQVGGSTAFRAFIADELMAEVRRRYRTNGQTAIVGESLAGLFVTETFLLRPKLFDTYIALSPSLWWNDEALTRGAAARLKKWPALKKTLYFASAGDDDIGNAIKVLRSALRSISPEGLTWYYESYPKLHHSDIYRRVSPAVFRKLFPPKDEL